MADKKYIVMSPDGFPIERDKQYANLAEAEKATEKFIEKYRTQGYYSQSITTVRKIPVDEIKDNCRLVEL